MAKEGAQAVDDADDVAAPKSGWSRDKLKAFVARHYHTRVHMSLILAACGLTAMSVSWSLLHMGVHSMLVRYPVAISLAYAMFLVGVWTWLRATGLLGGSKAAEDPKDAPASARKAKSGKSSWLDWSGGSSSSSGGGSGGGGGGGGGVRGGGGSFDGGGASSSFASTRGPFAAVAVQQSSASQQAAASSSSSSSSGSSSSSSWGSKAGGSLFDGIDGDGIVLLILALVLIGTVLISSGYLIWTAPDVLTEAAFGAGLTGTLARATKNHAEEGWVGGVVKKTWWPFAIVLVAAMAFAGWSAAHYPGATTFRQAITMAVHGN